MKEVIKSLLGLGGYEIRRIGQALRQVEPDDPDSIAAKTVKNAGHYSKFNSSVPLFMPWLEDDRFSEIYHKIRPSTLVSIDRCYFLYCLAQHSTYVQGDIAECGVYKGGTARLLCETTLSKNIHLFDAFSGLPSPDKDKDNHYTEGTFSDTSIQKVQQLLSGYVDRVQIHAGWMPNSFSSVEQTIFSLVHVDVDLYQTAFACCEFFYSRLSKGGVFVFDDYGFPACRGEKEAVDEFFSDKAETPICIPTGQAFVIKI